MSLHDYIEKIKHFLNSEKGKDILVVIIVILVGLGAFILGRLSKENDQTNTNTGYTDQNNDQNANTVSSISDVGIPQGSPTLNTSGKNFFASSKGKKYYTTNCSAGKNIKPANMIYFNTATEAAFAGYTLSSSCK